LTLGEYSFMSKEEQATILIDWNATQAEYPKDKTVHQLFEEQAERTPDNIAVVFEENSLTYKQLNNRANQLARVLREKGVTPDSIVGIMAYRSVEMIVGIIAVLKAGGAYLPIDPEHPEDRIAYILEDSETGIILTQPELADKARLNKGVDVIDLEDQDLYRGNGENLSMMSNPHNLAYIIYTSGSTGKPKGVMIEHTSVVNILTALQKKYPLSASDAYLLKTTYCFDVSVTELFGWFHDGGKLVILEPGAEKDPVAILKTIDENNVTHINFVPSMLAVFMNMFNVSEMTALNKLRYVFVAGEAVTRKLVEKFYSLTEGVTFENIYGPTELTIYATGYSIGDLQDEINVPIGKPLSNIRAYIVDRNNKLMPVGIPGELCVAGTCLARGYLKRPELNEEKFVANPFAPGERMYKTGDLVRWQPDGNIEYLGRIDHQVKIRGFRIELGEIENRLQSHEAIKEAVVVTKEGKEDSKYLCGYIVAQEELNITEIKEYLAKELPEYMIPTYIIQLEKIPLTSSGKADRKALPDPDGSMTTRTEYEAPRNDIEKILVEIWQEVLEIKNIGINDNFFALGGDSIKAIQVLSRLQKYKLKLDAKNLLTNPEIKELSKYVIHIEHCIAKEEVQTTSDTIVDRFSSEEFDKILKEYQNNLA
jgi:tyrocidine synthetase III